MTSKQFSNKLDETSHKVIFQASQNMESVQSDSVNLIVTSPPYPMISMWDDSMSKQNKDIASSLNENDGRKAFELMHLELDKVWSECYRVLKEGGFLCVNIGDATRTINGHFHLFDNHSRIASYCSSIGFTNLPHIIWRKQTNAPNKFMGSGMLPCGAYVTLEHEWILILRKGNKRLYKTDEEKVLRRQSAFFWEERNNWFSDLWEIKGVKQGIINSNTRERSAAYPLSIPYRLINMYSQVSDVVLDPFYGLGTTTVAAMIAQRNSIGFEIDSMLKDSIRSVFKSLNISEMNALIRERINNHVDYAKQRQSENKPMKYHNESLSCDVMTKQETDMALNFVCDINEIKNGANLYYECRYVNNNLGELFNP